MDVQKIYGGKGMLNIYKIESSALIEAKKILEAQEGMKEIEPGKQEYVKNEFARNGYILRDAKSMGIDRNCSYLYIDGPDEFFAKNEEKLTKIEGLEKTSGEEYEEIKNKIEAEAGGAEQGVGAVFDGF